MNCALTSIRKKTKRFRLSSKTAMTASLFNIHLPPLSGAVRNAGAALFSGWIGERKELDDLLSDLLADLMQAATELRASLRGA